MSTRLYIPDVELGKEIRLTKDQVRHLKVLRVKEGAKIRIFDGKGSEYEAIYAEKVFIEKQVKGIPEPKVKITLATAVPKGPRMDTLVEKVSELGVIDLVPIICSRSVVKPGEGKIERLRRIAIEACAQSERCIVPNFQKPIKFANLLDKIKEYNYALICHKSGKPLKKAFKESSTVLLIVGPEGDFTDAEMQAAEQAGCIKVSLGSTILRTETAAITAVAQIIALSHNENNK